MRNAVIIGAIGAFLLLRRKAIAALPEQPGNISPTAKQVLLYSSVIRREAARHGLPPALVAAVIHRESSGNARAFNPNDPSYGLMQLLLPTAQQMGYRGTVQGLYDPETNIALGTAYLGWQLKRYRGDIPSAVAAYNAGTAFRRTGGTFANQRYVDGVLRLVEMYKELI